jgi:hypothetical protein
MSTKLISCFNSPSMGEIRKKQAFNLLLSMVYARICSISSSTSSVNWTSTTLTFSSTCSGLLSPIKALATFGWHNTHASAIEKAYLVHSPLFLIALPSLKSHLLINLINKSFINLFDFGSLAWLPSGTFCPCLYFPVSTPCANSENTIWLMPFCTQTRITLFQCSS